MRVLLDAGLDPRDCIQSRNPPLMSAIKQNNLELVSLLLHAGADPAKAHPVAWGPLLQQQSQGGTNPNFFVHLTAPPYISTEDLNVTMDSEMCALTLAVAMAGANKFFDYRIIRKIVECGANVNMPVGCVDGMPQKNTALMIAAVRGPLPLVVLLLELGMLLLVVPRALSDSSPLFPSIPSLLIP
tara:strand:- start:575 stop:1129 length:555 start_codon:yes stop_codon:yes gene_type:complete